MTAILLMAALATVAHYLRNWITRPKRPHVEFALSTCVTMPATIARDIVATYLRHQGCVFDSRDGGVDLYSRGDRRITRLPTPRDIDWGEIPILVGVGIGDAKGQTVITLHYRALSKDISQSAHAQFLRFAKAEVDEAFAVVERLAQPRTRPVENARNQRPPSGARVADPPCQAEYTVLGLKPGAPWAQVQAAYREACQKFHPDRLTGQGVAPHLVELAVNRFKEVSAAYQRLKAHFGA